MSYNRRKFTSEFKEEAARKAIESSPKASLAATARELGVNEQTLRNWVNGYRRTHGDVEPPLTVPERARLRELEKENRELRMKAEFLGKCAAFFASDAYSS